jgi:spore germination cell wall hydrolase CwlJ-like protein
MKWFLSLFLYLASLPLGVLAQTYQERGVAAVLMGEAWSEGATGMVAVAEVIHQRAMEKGRTPLQVISAHGGRFHAFSCLNGTTLDRLIWKFSAERDYQRALEIAHTACQAPSELPGLAKSANYFTCATERPYWARGARPVAVIGHHAFYKLKQ